MHTDKNIFYVKGDEVLGGEGAQTTVNPSMIRYSRNLFMWSRTVLNHTNTNRKHKSI